MSLPSVSVVIVSRGRAADVPLCLLGVSQLDYPAFEVILVADQAGMMAARKAVCFEALKTVSFETANISEARNLGISQAAGEIVAFIDDDAVPEPTWLRHLVGGFADPEVMCAGGYVRGRNGISYQWTARSVDRLGRTHVLDIPQDKIAVLTATPDMAVKTEGTNMALRRDGLAEMGGFDPAFRFFLDETDVNLRLANAGPSAGSQTALVPMAEVHHGYKASVYRRADRVPVDLHQIGASLAVFLRKHASASEHDAAIARMRAEQRKRALTHMVAGRLEPRDVRRLMRSFEAGVREGSERALSTLSPIPRAADGFRPMPKRFSGHHVLTGRPWHMRTLLHDARQRVANGQRVSVFVFSATARRHTVRFTSDGIWLQTGGIFGQSTRKGPQFRLTTRAKKFAQELHRVAKYRGIEERPRQL